VEEVSTLEGGDDVWPMPGGGLQSHLCSGVRGPNHKTFLQNGVLARPLRLCTYFVLAPPLRKQAFLQVHEPWPTHAQAGPDPKMEVEKPRPPLAGPLPCRPQIPFVQLTVCLSQGSENPQRDSVKREGRP
jgi:hypothetical protein